MNMLQLDFESTFAGHKVRVFVQSKSVFIESPAVPLLSPSCWFVANVLFQNNLRHIAGLRRVQAYVEKYLVPTTNGNSNVEEKLCSSFRPPLGVNIASVVLEYGQLKLPVVRLELRSSHLC